MASPRILVQIIIVGSQIFGKALLEAGKQAMKNAKHNPHVGEEVAGLRNATSGSITDQLTRQHRMTLDEAHLILNLKRGDEKSAMTMHYEHLFNANSTVSHYLQSKVVRARERIEAEVAEESSSSI